MAWKEKINSLHYCLGTAINMGFALWAGKISASFQFVLGAMVLASVANHYFMVQGLSALINAILKKNENPGGYRLLMYLALKTISLVCAFLALVQFARPVVIQGLLIYVFQLIILFLSIKNMSTVFKKGFKK